MRCNFSVTTHPLKPVKQFPKRNISYITLQLRGQYNIATDCCYYTVRSLRHPHSERTIHIHSLDRFRSGSGIDFIFYFRAVERAGGSRYLFGRHIFAVVDRHVFCDPSDSSSSRSEWLHHRNTYRRHYWTERSIHSDS
mgnify:CR=1 FL=1